MVPVSASHRSAVASVRLHASGIRNGSSCLVARGGAAVSFSSPTRLPPSGVLRRVRLVTQFPNRSLFRFLAAGTPDIGLVAAACCNVRCNRECPALVAHCGAAVWRLARLCGVRYVCIAQMGFAVGIWRSSRICARSHRGLTWPSRGASTKVSFAVAWRSWQTLTGSFSESQTSA